MNYICLVISVGNYSGVKYILRYIWVLKYRVVQEKLAVRRSWHSKLRQGIAIVFQSNK